MRNRESYDEAGGAAVLAERRRYKRKPVLWAARVETRGGVSDCIILDLSLAGAKLRCAVGVVPHERVCLVIDRFGVLEAEVVWARMGLMGLRFRDPPEQIANLVGGALPLD